MNELKYKNQTVTIKEGSELFQSDVEKFGDVFDMAEMGKVNIPRRNGTAVRAAISAGWITTSTPVLVAEEVDKMRPDFVRWLGNEIMQIYLDVTKIDPNS